MATVNRSDPYGKSWHKGQQFDNRTKSALIWAEKQYLKRGKNRKPWVISQGSFSQGSMSAGTHSGPGAVDIGFAGVPEKHRKAIVKWLKLAGFAAWARTGPAWGTNNDHAHGILRGTRGLPSAAAAQVASFDRGRDGLAYDKPDPTFRPKPPRRWSHRQNKPIKKA